MTSARRRESGGAYLLPVAFLALTALLLAAGCATTPPAAEKGPERARALAAAEEATGIRIVGVRKTAAGHYLDLRYKILDLEKAAAHVGIANLHARLVHRRTGRTLQVPSTPKTGRMQQTKSPPRLDRVYFVLFRDNAGVAPGDTVDFLLRDTRFEGIIVQ
jgi:hypothetical protein